MSLVDFDKTLRAVFSDPRFKTELEWHREFGISSQLAGQWPREEMEHFVSTGEHVDPDRKVSVVVDEPPDFDWWEPRYDQPGRRVQTRYRELGVL